MTKLQFLNVFLTERLMLAAQEIYKSVEDTILEYQEEIALRERENDHLRRRLREAGIEIWPDRPSMMLEEEDGEHPRREWSPSMGHEERLPLQIKPDKRSDLRSNQGSGEEQQQQQQLRGGGGGHCGTPDSMFTPPRVNANDPYPSQEAAAHASSLPQQQQQNQGVENRGERGDSSSGSGRSSRHVKSEGGGTHRGGSASSNNNNAPPQPLAPVNPNCSNENNIDIIGVENGKGGGSRGQGGAHNMRGQQQQQQQQQAGNNAVSVGVDLAHQKSSPPHQPSSLHQQAHNMSSFCCKVCGEAFSHVGHLHVHVQVHTREKPYRCGVCGKCCSSSGRLQEHARSHTGEKPFRCQICGKGFTQMAHLKVHMRIHTGEKPYSCPVCGKCFSRSDKIKRHLQTHSREGTYFSGQ